MPIYALEIAGRNKRVLVKADSAAKAKDEVVKAKPLSAVDMTEAMSDGERVWDPSTPLPDDEDAEDAPGLETSPAV